MKKILYLLLIISFFSIFVLNNTYVSAQNRRERDGKKGLKEKWDRIEELKRLKMLEALNLSEEESIKFFSKYLNYRNQLRDFERERMKILDEMETLVTDKTKENELSNKLDALANLNQVIFEKRKEFYDEVRKILPVEKVAKYVIFERNFTRELQGILRDVQKERMKKR